MEDTTWLADLKDGDPVILQPYYSTVGGRLATVRLTATQIVATQDDGMVYRFNWTDGRQRGQRHRLSRLCLMPWDADNDTRFQASAEAARLAHRLTKVQRHEIEALPVADARRLYALLHDTRQALQDLGLGVHHS